MGAQSQWSDWERQRTDPRLRAVDEARRRLSARAAVRALESLRAEMPDAGPVRGEWLLELDLAQERAGKDRAALKSFEAAWEADPTNPTLGNAYACTAAWQGRDLDHALAGANEVLATYPAWDPWTDEPEIHG